MNMIYFDNSSTTNFKPETVINASVVAMKYLSANPGRAGHLMSTRAAMLVEKTRAKVASLVGASRDRVIFTSNCTEALNMAILGSAKLRGHVITTAYEHNSVLRPLFELKRQEIIEITVLRPNSFGVITADMIERAVKPNTYLVAVNHISNVTGAVMPITEIGKVCKKKNLVFLVDGAQSVGYQQLDIKEQNIDMLSIAPHKGLHCCQGIGCLVLSDNMIIKPVKYGGTGTDSHSLLQPKDLPEGFETGTLATPAIASLNASIDWNKENMFKIRTKLTSLSMYLMERLSSLKNVKIYSSPDILNGIISFNISDISSQDVANYLSREFSICVRGGLHCAPLVHKHFGTTKQGMVRVSFGIENNMEEIDVLVKAISSVS